MAKQPASPPSPGSGRSGQAAAAGPRAPANSRLRLHIAQLSDVGRARDHQEDTVGVFSPPDPALLARKGQLLIVADGMGGHSAGEVASETAVAEIQRSYFAATTDDIPTNLRQAMLQADRAIRRLATGDVQRQGMGTTAVVAVVREREVQIASIGDSRVYLLRGGGISQITQDHSWVAEQVRAGVLTAEQARHHPQRNVVTRALGGGQTSEPDLFNGVLQDGDVLLLCSDGLSNLVTESEMLEIAVGAAPEQAVRRLVELANHRGGSDNISVILARAEAGESGRAAATAPPRRLPAVALIVLALVLVAAGALAAVLLLRRGPREAAATATAGPAGAASAAAPTATLAELATPAGVITAALTPGLTPTATLITRETAAVTAAAASPATAARPATRPAGATQPAAAGRLPTPKLLEPVDGVTASLGLGLNFVWQWTGSSQDARFQLFVRRLGTDRWVPAMKALDMPVQFLVISNVPAVRDGGAGEYEWTVAVVNASGALLSDYAAPRRLVYQPVKRPTDTPRPTRTPKPTNTRKPTNTPRPTRAPTIAPPATIAPPVASPVVSPQP